jgi:hypothetical protein
MVPFQRKIMAVTSTEAKDGTFSFPLSKKTALGRKQKRATATALIN